MNWTPGPARCRSPEYEAEIAFTDIPGELPILGRVRKKGGAWCAARWRNDGRGYLRENNDDDLMPPTITREALARECARLYQYAPTAQFQDWEAVVAHVIGAVKAGRVE